MDSIKTKIVAPEGYEYGGFDEVNKEIIWKRSGAKTYKEVCERLFEDKYVYFVTIDGFIDSCKPGDCDLGTDLNNSFSINQVKKMLAYNKLMNIAEYINGAWEPDWKDFKQRKYCIYYNFKDERYDVDSFNTLRGEFVPFKSVNCAKEGMDLMGDDLDILFKL